MDAHQAIERDSRKTTLRVAGWRTLALVGLAMLAAGVWSTIASGQLTRPNRMTTTPLNPNQPTTYRDVLVFGLKARLPTELAYVESVVAAVEQGRLPARLVDQTFFWARTHAGSSGPYGQPNRPIIYFIPALNARLKKLHLNAELVGGLP